MKMSEIHADYVNRGHTVEYIAVPEKINLRDQFAMAALPALIKLDSIETVKEAAGAAYYIADAMLKAREAK